MPVNVVYLQMATFCTGDGQGLIKSWLAISCIFASE